MKYILLFLVLLVFNSTGFRASSQTAATNAVTQSTIPKESWLTVSNRWSSVPLVTAKQAAADGDLTAMYFLGRMYLYGQGVEKDKGEGIKWIRKASEHGHAHAQMILGYLSEYGDGVPRDRDEAARLYRLAAEQGDARAQNNLGWFYAQGISVAKDPVEAVKWYRKSAEQGDELVEGNLGWMYSRGLGVQRDYELAEKWGRKAAEQGTPRLQYYYAEILMNEYNKDSSQIANFPLAAEWYQKAAEQNYTDAQFALADMYYYGKLDRDYTLAVKWYSRAATNGNAAAVLRLGQLYADNHSNFSRNHLESARWYRIAAEKGDSYAQYKLALLLLEGDMPHDLPQATTWLQKASDAGYAEAAVKLAGLRGEAPQSVARQFNRQELDAQAVNSWGDVLLVLGIADEEGQNGPTDISGAAGMYLRVLTGGPEKDRPEAMNRFVNLFYTGRLKPGKPERTADFNDRSEAYHIYFWTAPNDEKQLGEVLKQYRKYASALAQYHVGEMFYRGAPLATNKNLALDWFKSAAQAGSPAALNRIGELWAAGISGRPDPQQAAGYYRKAAIKGLAAAQLNLARALQQGQGIEQNQVDACAWFQLAANQNLPEARSEAELLSAKLSPEERAAAKARAAELAAHIDSPPPK